MKNHRMTIMIEEENYAALKQEADKLGYDNVSFFVRHILFDYFNNKKDKR